MSRDAALSRLHYEIVRGLLDHSACPTNPELGAALEVSEPALEDLLRQLAAIHGVVLHPHICRPWIIHPFSLTPTLSWVEGDAGHGWWAPCIWCAFGVAALAGGDVRIHTRFGAESEPLAIPVRDGDPVGHHDLYVHFAIPPARAWDNVHQHCALVLPFRGPSSIDDWCARHGMPRGEAVPLPNVASLARHWYGTHARPDWRKWTITEAQEIFTRSGLDARFWDLGAKIGTF